MKDLIKRFLSIINVEYQERTGVFLLMFQAFFLGIFNGSFNIAIHSLFLDTYHASVIPLAYMFSGLIALGFTFLFFFLKGRFKYKSFIFYSLVFIFSVITLLSLGIVFKKETWMVYAGFLLIVPMNIITLHIFRNIINRLYTDHQSVRLSVIFEYSWQIGIVIISFLIPVVLYLKLRFEFIFGFCIFSLFFTLILEYSILKNFHFDRYKDRDMLYNPMIKRNLKNLLNDNYSILIILFIIFAAVVNYAIHFSFLTVSVGNFQSEIGFAKFFGVFYATLTIFLFVSDRIFLSRLLKNLGMPYSIILSPLIIGLFVLVAAILGSLTSSVSALGGYSFLFMLISLGKLMEKTFEYSVNEPSVKILYQLVNEKNKVVIRELIYGTIGGLTIFVSGALIYVCTSVLGLNIFRFLFVLLGIFIAWFLLDIKIIKSYRERLKNKVADLRNLTKKQQVTEHTGELTEDIRQYYECTSPDRIIYLLRLMETINPFKFENLVIKNIQSEYDEVRSYSLDLIYQLRLYEAREKVDELYKTENNPRNKKKAEEILSKFSEELDVSHTYESLADLVFSDQSGDKLYACNFLRIKGKPEHKGLINVLLKDIEPEIRIKAIEAAPKINSKESIPILIDYLLSPHYFPYAYHALTAFGGDAVRELEHLFYDNNMDARTLERSVRIYGEIKSSMSLERLFAKFDSLNKFILHQAVLSIKKMQPTLSKVQTNLIIKQVVKKIEVCAWNMAAHISSRRIKNNEILIKALNEEIEINIKDIFLLLSLIYESNVIRHVEELVLRSKAEGIAYALEILDLFIDQDVRNVLFPLLEDLPLEVKVRQLQFYFPIEKMRSVELLNTIINRDYNLISSWTKACAIWCLNDLSIDESTDDLIACIFSPEKLLSETASSVIYRKDKNRFNEAVHRLGDLSDLELETSMDLLSKTDSHLVFNKLYYLKKLSCFEGIKNEYLQDFARSMQNIELKDNDELKYSGNIISIPVLFIVEGNLNIYRSEEYINMVQEGTIVDPATLLRHEKDLVRLVASGKTLVYYIERDIFSYNLFDRTDLLFGILENSNNYFKVIERYQETRNKTVSGLNNN